MIKRVPAEFVRHSAGTFFLLHKLKKISDNMEK